VDHLGADLMVSHQEEAAVVAAGHLTDSADLPTAGEQISLRIELIASCIISVYSFDSSDLYACSGFDLISVFIFSTA